jgi:hypothetical protein
LDTSDGGNPPTDRQNAFQNAINPRCVLVFVYKVNLVALDFAAKSSGADTLTLSEVVPVLWTRSVS